MIIIRTVKKIAIFFLLLLFSSPVFVKGVSAASVSLDSTFGTNGKTITSFGNNAIAPFLALQSDGKKILVGRASNGSNNDWASSRYNPDGGIDTSFGDNGIILKDFGSVAFGHSDFLTDVALSDGKILVGGSSASSSTASKWTLARYNSDGTLDSSFGIDGIIITTIRSGSIIEYVNDLIIQQDNKIVAIGVSHISNTDVALARYNSDSSLDTTFGNGGTVITVIGSINDRGNAAILQPDGKIIVLGDFDAGGHDEIFLTRYNSNGSLDSSFGSGGKAITQIGSAAGARDMVLQPDGKIVVTGGTVNNGLGDTYVIRYNADGTLDNAFGTGGKAIISFASSHDSANSMILQSDGKIVLGGYEDSGGSSGIDFALRRFNVDGTLDSTFDDDGSFVSPISTGHDEIVSIAIQNDGKIIAAGHVFNGNYFDWAIARFVASNDIDLAVPLLKQTDPLWGNFLYDSADGWAPPEPDDISRWGCALTSAAMVFRYHGITKLPNGIGLNPGTLNVWLLNDKEIDSKYDGYIRNGLVNWIALARMSMQAKDQNPDFAFDALDYVRYSEDHNQLKTDLENNIPGILGVNNDSHFVVAKGVNSEEVFTINDPFYDREDLSAYSNSFSSLGRFIPSSTDLSYIMLVVDEEINVSVENSSGDPVGESFIQQPLEGDETPGNFSGDPLRMFYLSDPTSGEYTLNLSSSPLQNYQLDVYYYDANGDVKVQHLNGILGSDGADELTLEYNKENINESETIITFDDLIDDINSLYGLGEINFPNRVLLLAQAKIAKKLSGNSITKKASINILKAMQKKIMKQKGKGVSSNAYDILSSDLKILISSL